jgi:hypothetical protein
MEKMQGVLKMKRMVHTVANDYYKLLRVEHEGQEQQKWLLQSYLAS